MSTLKLEAKTDNLTEVIAFIDGILEENDCPMKVQFQIDVAVRRYT